MKKLADFCRNTYWILTGIIAIPTVIVGVVLLVKAHKDLKMESIEGSDEEVTEE